MESRNFYLGTHQPHWLAFSDFPLFVSRRRLEDYKVLPIARSNWSQDSGGFTELSMYGEWTINIREYVKLTRRFRDEIGKMDWAAPMDWMCEPFILEMTKKNVLTHQRRTVLNYVALMEMAPDVPWIPVLQGWHPSDYLRCIDLYARYRVDLTKLPVVGVGSICRRQGEVRIAMLLEQLAGCGLKLHGFGIKLKGLELAANSLYSADSMAWSYTARRLPTQCGSKTHKNCANCYEFAEDWRDRVATLIERTRLAGSPLREVQADIFSSEETGSVLPGLSEAL